MLQALLNPILPVFAILFIGAVFARRGVFDTEAAQTINRFVFHIGVPALLFALLVEAPISGFDWEMMLLYLVSELLMFGLGTALARLVFKRALGESILLGMAAGFVNHVFFVLPIGTLLYGESARLPIAAIITMDSVMIFALAIVWLELAAHRGGSMLKVSRLLARNPMLQVIAVGMAVNLLEIRVHPGIMTFATFVGASAAPVALFALGIILASARIGAIDFAALSAAGLKVLIHPLIAGTLFVSALAADDAHWLDPALLVAAGPCGAMPFVLAVQYDVKADSIAKAIVYSTVASLITLAVIA